MSKLSFDSAVPSDYDGATFTRIIRAICQQVNLESEGKLAARYQAQSSSPSVAAAIGDIAWNSTPSSGGPLGWVCVASGNPGTFYPFGGMPVLGTKVATTSGTSIDFTGIPSWVTRIEFNVSGISTSGTSNYAFQIGDSGGIETAGYAASAAQLLNAAAGAAVSSTAAFPLTAAVGAANTLSGQYSLTLLDAATNTWTFGGGIDNSGASQVEIAYGAKALSATLDRVRLTTLGGADTFDAGIVNIRMT